MVEIPRTALDTIGLAFVKLPDGLRALVQNYEVPLRGDRLFIFSVLQSPEVEIFVFLMPKSSLVLQTSTKYLF